MVARALEQEGIATVVIQSIREIAERIRPPRAVFLRFPYGQALGEPGNRLQHLHVIKECLDLLGSAREGGQIVEPGFRWRRETYSEIDW